MPSATDYSQQDHHSYTSMLHHHRSQQDVLSKKRRRADGETSHDLQAFEKLELPTPTLGGGFLGHDGADDDDDNKIGEHVNSNNQAFLSNFLQKHMTRKTIPLSPTKRVRYIDPDTLDQYQTSPRANNRAIRPLLSRSTTAPFSLNVPPSAPPATITPHTSDRPLFSRATTSTATPSRLTPCHICHRHPTKKSDLDSFGDCEGCALRTCYVCMRACPGWESQPGNEQALAEHSATDPARDVSVVSQQEVLSRSFHMEDVSTVHGGQAPLQTSSSVVVHKGCWTASGHCQVVCSRCCVERGAEGDVVCLGCLARMEAA